MWKTKSFTLFNGKYIEVLNTLQEDVGFTLANKLKRKHTMWTKHKTNFSLAAQSLSASVASSIDFLWEQIHLSEFEDSEYTTDFIKENGHCIWSLWQQKSIGKRNQSTSNP